MNIRFLETVVWLSELRSFRVTADRMNITPAAISNRISAIEQELGIRLFERDTRDVRLTGEGQTFVSGARDIIDRYNRLVSDVVPAETIEGTVRIGILPSIALTILPGVIETLRVRYPRVRVSVTTDSSQAISSKLEQRALDVVLGFPTGDVDKYFVKDLCSFGMFWVANGGFECDEGPMAISDLSMHPIISYETGTYNHGRLFKYLSGHLIEDSIIHYSNSLSTTISMVTAGIGIAVLPPIVIQNELRSGTLRVLKVSPVFPPTNYFALFMRNPSSRLSSLVASIACDVANDFCALYSDALASSVLKQVDNY